MYLKLSMENLVPLEVISLSSVIQVHYRCLKWAGEGFDTDVRHHHLILHYTLETPHWEGRDCYSNKLKNNPTDPESLGGWVRSLPLYQNDVLSNWDFFIIPQHEWSVQSVARLTSWTENSPLIQSVLVYLWYLHHLFSTHIISFHWVKYQYQIGVSAIYGSSSVTHFRYYKPGPWELLEHIERRLTYRVREIWLSAGCR